MDEGLEELRQRVATWGWFRVTVVYGWIDDATLYYLQAPNEEMAAKFSLSRYRYDFPSHDPIVDSIHRISEVEGLQGMPRTEHKWKQEVSS